MTITKKQQSPSLVHLFSASATSAAQRSPENSAMHMLYDSDSFVVLQVLADMPFSALPSAPPSAAAADTSSSDPAPSAYAIPRNGFEIVDKRSGKEVYLEGAWAELFQQEMSSWGQESVSQEDIEATLERYASLAQNPVLLH